MDFVTAASIVSHCQEVSAALNSIDGPRGEMLTNIENLRTLAESKYVEGWQGGDATEYRNKIIAQAQSLKNAEKWLNAVCYTLKQWNDALYNNAMEQYARAQQLQELGGGAE